MKKLLASLVIAAAIGGVAYGVFTAWGSKLLQLRRVEVAGNERVSKEDLVAATGLHAGLHLLQISTQQVSARVETIPWISSARVERIVPSTVRITVVERSAVAEVVLGTRSFLADATGILLEEKTGDLLKIVDVPSADARPGARLSGSQYLEALAVIDAIPDQLRARVDVVSAPSVDRITLRMKDASTVLYGAAENIDDKNFAIRSLFDEAARQGKSISSIDVRVPNRPAVRFK